MKTNLFVKISLISYILQGGRVAESSQSYELLRRKLRKERREEEGMERRRKESKKEDGKRWERMKKIK